MPKQVKNMVWKAFFYFTGSVLLIASVAGCAGLQGKGGVAPGPSPAEVKLVETNKELDAANAQISAFYAQLNSVVAEINELRSRPCWNGFEKILMEYPSLRDLDKKMEITPEMKSRLSQWGRKWKAPWEKTLQDYFRLVNRCAILEVKRVAARQMLISVQAGYMAVVMMEAAAGHEKKSREIFSLVNSLDKPGAELDSHRLNGLGLYGAGQGG